MLRAFATLLLERRLRAGAPLIGSDALTFRSSRASGALERGRLEDAARHAVFSAPGLGVEP